MYRAPEKSLGEFNLVSFRAAGKAEVDSPSRMIQITNSSRYTHNTQKTGDFPSKSTVW